MAVKSRLFELPIVVLIALASTTARADGPADSLLGLVPQDAGLTLVVENLRDHSRQIVGSPIAARLWKSPLVQGWLRSEHVGQFRQAQGRVETLLGERLRTVVLEVFGEAVVLALNQPAGAAPDAARGILVTKVTNRALLDRLIGTLNAALKENGELVKVVEKTHAGVPYQVREFRPGSRLTEYYAILSGSAFMWSNSEALIQRAIDRSIAGKGRLADLPWFRDVRGRLPKQSTMSLYVNPRYVERLLGAAPGPKTPEDEAGFALVGRFLASSNYAGLALEWHDGPILHFEQTIDPAKVDPSLKRWASRPSSDAGLLLRVPTSAMAVGSFGVDFVAVLDLIEALIPAKNQPKVANAMGALKGILLGRDVRKYVLPDLNSRVVLFANGPTFSGPKMTLPLAVEIGVTDQPEGEKTGEALDNALRTVLALYALDDKHEGGRLQVESRAVSGGSIVGLGKTSPFFYCLASRRLVVGNADGTVEEAVAAHSDSNAGTRLRAFRETYFPGSGNFFYLDVRALGGYVSAHRTEMSAWLTARQGRPGLEVALDLERGFALLQPFDAAFLTMSIDPAFTRVHHTLGLVAKPDQSDGVR